MTLDELTVAYRLVSHPKWRWQLGMKTTDGVVIGVQHNGVPIIRLTAARAGTGAALPDLRDPAVQGWVFQYTMEAMGGGEDWPAAGAENAEMLLDLWGDR